MPDIPATNLRKRKKRAKKQALFFLLVGPAILLRIFISIYPVLQTVYLSFLEVNLITNAKRYVGLRNFLELLQDPTIKNIFLFTMLFVVSSTRLQLLLGLGIASLLNVRFRGRQFVRTVNLIPWAIPTVVAGLAFRWMFDDQHGLITDILSRFIGFRPAPLVFPLSAELSGVVVN
ncbi:MAG: carbohydrate ABC transporter permease, partial [Candidatus Caldatribacteriaceae bacterium]